jgi:phosphate/sulfate permease
MNIKKLLTLSLLICLTVAAFAQADTVKKVTINMTIKNQDTLKRDTVKKETIKKDTSWHVGGIINVAFSQVSFTNWAAGGQNSIGLVAMVSIYANYNKNKISWLNSLDLAYGFQKLDNEPYQKTTDKIEATTNAGYTVFDHTLAGILVDFKSQFAPGYQFPNDSDLLSKFMAPGYLTIAAGLTYKPNEALSIFLSPATLKYTLVEDQVLANEGDFGVTPAVYNSAGVLIQNGKEILLQAGAYFKGDYSATVCKGITLTTDLQLFSNYLKDPQDIVVDWTNLIQLKVNKWISVTVNTELIYDQNILIPIYNGDVLVGKGPRTQFKEISGLGLAYNL